MSWPTLHGPQLRFRGSFVQERLVLAALALIVCVAARAEAQDAAALRFVDSGLASGVDFVHRSDRSPARLLPENLGAGVVLADVDHNGAVDIVLINGGKVNGRGRNGTQVDPADRTRLFLNDGKGAFRDATEEWRVPSSGYGMGGAAGDFDNDGKIDILLTHYGSRDVLLRNTGTHFVDVTEAANLTESAGWSSSAGFFDLEGDGDLDLWIVRYLQYDPAKALPCFYKGQQVYCTPELEEPSSDRLFLNRGDGSFVEVSERLSGATGKGLALAIGDVNLDGRPDVYVANDTTSNHLWINQGGGQLSELALLSGVALSETGRELAGMGADLTDVNQDGQIDLGSTNFQDEPTAIYLQIRDGVFREASDSLGVGQAARARLSFGMDFFDADNDGDEDLLVANGHIYDNLHLFSQSVTYGQQNTLYEHVGSGRFRDVSNEAGPALLAKAVSRGLATADLDGDGDLDFVINNLGGKAQIGLNETRDVGNFVSLWLEGTESNRSALGARVVAKVGDRNLMRQVQGASSYLSMNDPRVHLGLGTATMIDRLTIHWPGSSAQTLQKLKAGKHYFVRQGESPQEYRPGGFGLTP